ncbi:MAG: thiamine pyrophosphate-binding protein [Thaumarchaeota archaeon]|nr:thiamine pyrophosphate-binding protein [Nitrososphaerota archaeon]
MLESASRNKQDIDESVEVKTGGHWLLKILESYGVQFVFGTTGAGMPEIQDAMVVVKPPKWIQGLHEFTSVCAAMGYSLASGKPGVALIDRVCGTLNCAGAFYAAFLNSSPIVVLASSNVPGVPIPGGSLEYHYAANPTLPISPWVKWAATVESLDTMPEDLAKSFFMAMSEHQGPTYIAFRQDLAATTPQTKGRITKVVEPYLSPRVPDDSTLKKIVNEILSSGSAQIITAQIGRHPDAMSSLVEFAHTFGIGVGETRFFVNYPFADPLHVGFMDIFASLEVLKSTELLLAIELGLLPQQRFDVPVIDLASDPFHRQDVTSGGDYGASISPAIVRAACDSGPTLDKLVAMGKELMTTKDREAAFDRIARFAEIHDKNVSEWRAKALQSYNSETLTGWSIGHVINKHWKEGMSLVDGTMSLNDQIVRTIELSKPGTYFSNPSAHLGASVGMAYGVALADRNYVDVKDRGTHKIGRISESPHIVVSTMGDGEAVMGNLPSALWTCQHYGLGVLYVILNNACWAAEWPPFTRSPELWAKRAQDYEFIDIDNPRFDFAKIAESLGVYGKRLTSSQEFDATMEDALNHVRSGKPAVLDLWMEKYTGQKASSVP